MWFLERDVEISSSHRLNEYVGKCSNVHGHNWKVTIYCKGTVLDKCGILVDFSTIKKIVEELDHKHLNDILPCNPTAENIAQFLCEEIPHCYKVMVEESEGARCYYVKSE